MSNNKFTSLQKQAGLSNEQAAKWLNVSLRTVERWRAKEAPKVAIMCLEYLINSNYLNHDK